jgi:hypothetical protein
MSDKELSDLSIERKECKKCGAVWINGEHYWTGTGKRGSELDLGLVCNKYGDDFCINPAKGREGGDTWEKRFEDLEKNGPEQQI